MPPQKKRKPGAQKGNNNALKHGFYSKQFKAEEKKRLDQPDIKELESEINLIRVMIGRLTEILDIAIYTISDGNGNQRTDSHYLEQLNTLSNMSTSLASLKRTQYMIQGRSSALTDAIEEAMEEIRLELGI